MINQVTRCQNTGITQDALRCVTLTQDETGILRYPKSSRKYILT